MSWLTNLLDHLLNAPAWTVLLVVGLVVFAEDALFVGFVLPGESAAVLGGVAASRGHVPVWAVALVVVVSAIVGDTVGYEVGKHFGPRLLRLKILDKRRAKLEQAQDFLARRGGVAVLLGRWTAFFRAVMPALAGSARMPYPRFLAFNATGGLLWGIAVVAIGYLAGNSYAKVEQTFGRTAGVVVVALLVVGFVVWRVREHRKETTSPAP
jgi:membrane-associated protein